MSLSQIFKFFSGFCQVGPPPISAFQNIDPNTQKYEELKSKRDALAEICNDIGAEIARLTIEFNALSAQCEIVSADGNRYRDPIAFADLSRISDQRKRLQTNHDKKFTYLNNIKELIDAYENTKDAAAMSQLLKTGEELISKAISEVGGTAEMIDAAENAAKAIYQVSVISNIVSMPLGASSSTEIPLDINIAPIDKEKKFNDLLDEIHLVNPAIASPSSLSSSSSSSSNTNMNISYASLPSVPSSQTPVPALASLPPRRNRPLPASSGSVKKKVFEVAN